MDFSLHQGEDPQACWRQVKEFAGCAWRKWHRQTCRPFVRYFLKEVMCMTNYREILRLDSIGLNRTEIAVSCGCSRNTVAGALKRVAECGLSWPLPADMSD